MRKIKQSATDWSFFDASIQEEEFYARIKEIGFEAIEMVPPERRKAAAKAGLVNLNLSGPGMEVGLNELENHDVLVPQIIEAIEEAVRDGIPHVIIFSGNRNGADDAVGLQNCMKAIEKFIGYAESKNIVLLFEMLNSYDHVGYQADSSAYGFDIVRKFNSPYLKALYDVYHMFRMGEDVVADIKNNTDLIGHIHLAGSPKRDCIANPNDIDYRAVVAEIAKTSYAGYLGQEFMVTENRYEELTRAFNLADSI